ncbi:hypothetical protein [Streptomyces malaysiense]|uniref:Uncharacterized protein n=1 Tax=Streptomyces malaysiense TaxID=1428626 RepID=A0A1J4PVF5_9ACTN|nr:hypothetical protein [Streptomyces malaysiense]OIK23824.1 hypothetical protein VT52_030290 [Streptomyces malaysiense]
MTNTDGNGHGMAQDRIALLLADAAREIETGAAPVTAVVRGGRRRRARRLTAAVAAAAAVLTCGTVTAVNELPDRGSASPAGTGADRPLVYEPVMSTVGEGTRDGGTWSVNVQVWPAPRDRGEAVRQMKAMADWGFTPVTSGSPSDLIGKTTYFFIRAFEKGGESARFRLVTSDTVAGLPSPKGTGINVFTKPLTPDSDAQSLVVGMVATTARQVTCHWKDGSATTAELAPANTPIRPSDAVIRSVRGFPTANWFVCAAPGSTSYKSAEVTK